MTRNKLKLNDEKTEFFIASLNHNFSLINNISISIGGSVILPSSTIKNLGVMFDRTMSMTEHVK